MELYSVAATEQMVCMRHFCCPDISWTESTAIAGYSLGGMMALYTIIHYNRWFSKAAVISASLALEMHLFKENIEHTEMSSDTRIFFSLGTAEGSEEEVARQQNNILTLEKPAQKQGVRSWRSIMISHRMCRMSLILKQLSSLMWKTAMPGLSEDHLIMDLSKRD